ncbi:MAG: Tetratricopeptide repeat [Blastocatellia bacterium]|nr:Tetratricopeptide repeat [Blastocatellia bacterium]
MFLRLTLITLLLSIAASPQRPGGTLPKTITISTEPNAIVWIDDIRRGVTDGSGNLSVKIFSPGRHTLRIRGNGFRETTVPLLSTRAGMNVKLVRTDDAAELAFQQAETAREQGKDAAAKKAAVELYQKALHLRPAYPAANVGLARVLMDLGDIDGALEQVAAGRRARRIYPEASAVEGRIHRENTANEKAITAFRRAIREGRGFQPEAHVGLARIWEEKNQWEDAASEYEIAIKQLSESEPVIYQLLGAVYEKLQKPKEAVTVYEKYLEIAPDGSYASAIRSIIEQLRREAAGQQLLPE